MGVKKERLKKRVQENPRSRPFEAQGKPRRRYQGLSLGERKRVRGGEISTGGKGKWQF
jgi:hypothetical protein